MRLFSNSNLAWGTAASLFYFSVILFNKFLNTLLSYCLLYSFGNIKQWKKQGRRRRIWLSYLCKKHPNISCADVMTGCSDLSSPSPLCLSITPALWPLHTHTHTCTSSVRPRKLDLFLLWAKKPLNTWWKMWWVFLQCLLDLNVFPTNTTDLVCEGEESAFFPVAVSLTQHSGRHLANHKHPLTCWASVIKYLPEGKDVKE